jgi:hypothetical protein
MTERPSIKHKDLQAPPTDVAPAGALTDAWCPRCGWIRAEHVRQERGYGSCCTACTRRTGQPIAVEAHWGPCPRCRVAKVYRPAGEPQAPQCGACQGILRGRLAVA